MLTSFPERSGPKLPKSCVWRCHGWGNRHFYPFPSVSPDLSFWTGGRWMSFDVLKTGVRPERHSQLLYLPQITVPLSQPLQNPGGKSGFIQFLFGVPQTCSFRSSTSTRFSNSSLITKNPQSVVNKGFWALLYFHKIRKSGKWKLTLYVDFPDFRTEHELC